MKKRFIFLISIVFMAILSVGLTYGIHIYDDVMAVPEPVRIPADKEIYEPQTEEVTDSYVSIAITAIGDCTLGTDTAFGTVGTLGAEAVANKGDYSYFMRNVRKYFKDDDLTIANLEGPLSNGGVRVAKQFAFRGSPDYVGILYGSSVDAVNLANNHAKDYGEYAYADTKNTMSNFGITPFGNEEFAIVDIKGIKVGLIGTNALNRTAVNNYRKLFEELKGEVPDLIVANFHWGVEKSAYANGEQVYLAHEAIDKGADLVIGHHPHVLQGIEQYKGKYIVYSLGNFCFGGNKNPVDKDTMIFKQTFNFKNGELLPETDVAVVPCSISSVPGRNNYQPTPLTGNDFERVKTKIMNRSSLFKGVENVQFIEG